MNYGKQGTKDKIKKVNSKSKKYTNKMLLIFAKGMLVLFLFAVCVGAGAGFGALKGILDNAPEITPTDVVPLGAATTVLDVDGNVIATLVTSGSNRDPVTYDEIPEVLINAFIAIEDARFWQHKGIDLRSIMRAAVGVLTNQEKGGGSTITQQLIKNNVFEGGMETSFGAQLERKFQEQYLALQLEKSMDKKIIMENYLNTINLGTNTLGVQAASKRYFNKDVSELTLSEATVIAGITKNPSANNPITYPENNADRRKLILQAMYDQEMISKEEQEEALADDVYSRIQDVNAVVKWTTPYSYFVDELTEQVMDDLQNKAGYTENQAFNMVYSGGLTIQTTQDPRLQAIVDEEINNPDNYTVVRYSMSYRLSVEHADGTQEHFSEESIKAYNKNVLGRTSYDALFDSQEEVQAAIDEYKAYLLKDGDKIIGERLTTTLQPQTSFVLLEQKTGYVKAISGGRGAKTGSLTLNRATNTLRQPGSTFKVLTSFAPALDTCGNTLGTTYYDEPFAVGAKSISNWWNSSNGYVGYSNIRQGITYSMNIIAARTLMETVTPQLGVEYGKNFGITTLVDQSRTYADGSVRSDLSASLALGGLTDGVSNLELTAAYAAIANGGVYTQPIFYTKILDHNGRVIIDNQPEVHTVLKESTAFLLTDSMKDSITGHRYPGTPGAVNINPTSGASKIPGMSTAGKSGTTTGNNDIWFVGYTPYYTAGIWAGCDENQKLTSKNGGASFHKPIWQKIMTRIHDGLSDPGFAVPDSLETASICIKSGKLAVPGVCDLDPRGSMVYTEYFAKGTVPTEVCDHHVAVTICSDSGQLAGEYCPEASKQKQVYMILPPDSGVTDDSRYALPAELVSSICSVHGSGGVTYPSTGSGESQSSGSQGYGPGGNGPGGSNQYPGVNPTVPGGPGVSGSGSSQNNYPKQTTAAPTTEAPTTAAPTTAAPPTNHTIGAPGANPSGPPGSSTVPTIPVNPGVPR